MRWYKKLLFFLLLAGGQAQAQNFGGFPPSVRWRQINTDTARIIFSGGAQQQANRIAALIHQMAADTPAALGNRTRKINVVLHHNTTLANGYVGLAPFRSEFYLIPSFNIFEFGNLPWHENLAVHEYRHVQQYNNFNNGLTRLFRVLGGEGGQALANALTIPDWFFEGDAVWAETALTQMGRGRRPYFLSAYKSLWQAGKEYNWMKLRNGSYKDFVPNHYHLGYLLVNYGYGVYGEDFWKKVTLNASSFKGLLYPFQKGIETHSEKDFKTFRKEALSHYAKEVTVDTAVERTKTVTHYYFPKAIDDDSIIYVKESYKSIPAFYIKSSKGEKRIAQKSIGTEDGFSYKKGKVAYTAYATHPRWSLINYSDIVVLDINTKGEKRITEKGRYFTPQFSPDGSQILVVFINETLQTELHLLHAESGAVLKKINARNGAFFIHPQFVNREEIVVGIRQPDGAMSLQMLNLVDGSARTIVASSFHTLGYPSINQDHIYFTASFQGNDDLFAYSLTKGTLHQLTAGHTGFYFPEVQNDSLLFSNYTAYGMQLQKKALKGLLWKEVPQAELPQAIEAYDVAEADVKLLNIQEREFETSTYHKATGLINFHSWDPGLSLYSNNILNTFSTQLYYRYNESERSHTTGWSASYGGWFPQINSGVEYIFNRHLQQPGQQLTYNTLEARIGYAIPLSFTKGKTAKGLNFGSNFVYNRTYATGALKDSFETLSSSYLHHFASWAQQLPVARQHIYSKWGYATSVAYRHRLHHKGYQANGGVSFYLPSLFTNHSLVLTGTFQQVDTGALFFSNRFSLARGYTDYYYSRMWNGGINYHMPLLYPDWGFANILYFMRIRSNLYFDYSTVFSRNKTQTAALRSTGAEIYFDTKWWNQLPVTFGVRYSYLLDETFAQGNPNRFELIIPVDLIPL